MTCFDIFWRPEPRKGRNSGIQKPLRTQSHVCGAEKGPVIIDMFDDIEKSDRRH
jgi:hypothetical protein